MQTANFTLPSGGTVEYCPWIRPSNDSLFSARFGSLKYALDFYDTTGVFLFRLDSLTIHDSLTRIHPDLRVIYPDCESNQRGYAVFHRVSGAMEESSAVAQSIIARKRLSKASSFKRSAQGRQLSASTDISLGASPNPFKAETNLFLKIPESGPVTIEAFNALGNSMGYLCKSKVFSGGSHELIWKAGKLSSGVYILRMQYGNEVISARVVAME